LERLELIAGITGTISSEGRARGGNVAPLPDNPSTAPNIVDQTWDDLDLDRRSQPTIVTAKFPIAVTHVDSQCIAVKQTERVRNKWK